MSMNWAETTLGESCKFYNGKAHENHIDDSGNFIVVNSKFISSDGTKAKRTNHALFPLYKDDIAMVMSDVPKGKAIAKCYLVETDGKYSLNQRICVIRSNKFDIKFLYYHLNRHPYLLSFDNGENQTNLRKNDILNCPLYVPSIPEQKRIVAIVDQAFEAIDGAIENTKRNLANARELFESYLNSQLLAVVSGKVSQTLLCITDLIIDCEHKTAPIQEEGIPSIRTPNIGKGYLIFDDVYRVSEETYELWTRRGKPEPGDLILAREAPAGNVGVIPPGAKVCLGQRTVLIRPKKQIIDSHYLAFLLLHPIVQKRLLDKSTGATVQHVNMKDIRALSMSELPSIQVQRDCVNELEHLKSEVNRLEVIYRQKLAALTELKQSILQKAFTGELTTDQKTP